MAFRLWTLRNVLLSILSLYRAQASAQATLPGIPSTNSSLCPTPAGFANNMIRAPLSSSPELMLKLPFLLDHILFFYTDQNTALSEAAVASFCLDQCIGYQPNPSAGPLPTDAPVFPASYVGNKPGPCLSFTVDMGKPYPPNPKDTAMRWYCEAFDHYLAEDLSDFEPVNTTGSYMQALAVNRACSGIYRAF